VNPIWDEENGLVGVEVLVGAAGVGEVEAAYLRVWRSLDAGSTWLLVSDNVLPGSTVADLVPPLNSTVTYMAEAVSALPSVRSSTNVDVFTSCAVYNRVWLNAGYGFTVACFLSPECDVSVASGREVDLIAYSGREKPVEYSSPHTNEVIQVKGVIVRDNDEPTIATSSFDDWRNLIKNYWAPMCLRDLRGHRWWVSVSDFGYDGMHRKFQSISFTATEIDWSEPRTVV
jgi:hypothetical protein